MTINITAEWVIEVLLNGLAISLTAFLLPFVKVKNFGTAILVGILISLVNYGLWWLLGNLGISFGGAEQLGKSLINFFIYVVAILIVDAVMTSFRVSGFIMAAVFAVVVAVINHFLTAFLATLLPNLF